MFASGWRRLIELGSLHPGAPALVDPGFMDPGYPLTEVSVGALSRRLSATPLIHYARTPCGGQEWPDGGLPLAARLRSGMDDELSVIDATILRCTDLQSVERLLARLRSHVDADTCQVFHRILNLAIGATTVPAVAASFELTERALQRRCAALGIPSPKTLLSLARTFTVERLATWSRQPSGRVSVALGFSDQANYRRMIRRTLGASPSVIRDRGGPDLIVEAIVATLSGHNAERPASAGGGGA